LKATEVRRREGVDQYRIERASGMEERRHGSETKNGGTGPRVGVAWGRDVVVALQLPEKGLGGGLWKAHGAARSAIRGPVCGRAKGRWTIGVWHSRETAIEVEGAKAGCRPQRSHRLQRKPSRTRRKPSPSADAKTGPTSPKMPTPKLRRLNLWEQKRCFAKARAKRQRWTSRCRRGRQGRQTSIRVQCRHIDNLMTMVSELVATRNQCWTISRQKTED